MMSNYFSAATTRTTTRKSDEEEEDAKETKSNTSDEEVQPAAARMSSPTASTTTTTTNTSWLRAHAKEFMDEWTRAGLSRYVDLPMICVLGDTSSGKSSVLSSLIGLELPSASTLTTKCPVLIQLQHSDDGARAVIDIQWHSNHPNAAAAAAAAASKSNTPKRDSIGAGGGGLLDDAASPRERKRLIEQQLEQERQSQNEVGGSDQQEQEELPTTKTTNLSTTPRSPPSSKKISILSSPPSPPPPPPPKWQARTITQNLETEVPQCIQEAQTLILNYREALVAPDVICITLWSSECVEELTLVDLPGLVQFQNEHDISLLSQVEQVILKYVQNPRSILVPVLAAPTNIHNSKVLQWAKDVDPTTKRTIPVLTKPDLMDPGSESDVLDLLQQQQPQPRQQETPTTTTTTTRSSSKGKFYHGFYMVMNRGQAQLDVGATLQTGLKMEEEYFATTLPWNAITEPRLGIPNLRSRLAQVLWQVMQDSMADILAELHEQFQDTQSQLNDMGTIFHTRVDQRKFYHNLSHQLVAQVASSLSGKGPLRRKKGGTLLMDSSSSAGSSYRGNLGRRFQSAQQPHRLFEPSQQQQQQQAAPGGASRLHAACHEFLQEIQGSSLATINKLVEGALVVVSSPGHPQDVRGEIVHIAPTGTYACVDYVDEKDHVTDVLFDGIDYVSSDQPEDFEVDEVWSEDGSRVFIGREGGHFDSLRKIPCSRIRTDPSWLQEKIAQFRTDDLACFINVDMFQHIVAEFVHEDWSPPCNKLVDTLQEILTETLDTALHDHLQPRKRFPLLEQMVESTCHRVAQKLMESARSQVLEHLEMEEMHPYTQDEVLLQAMSRARFKSLRSDLELQLRLDQEGVVYDTQAIQAILDRVFAKHEGTNWMAEQMELVLSCYGQVATQRVLDRTPQICWQTCRNLSKALQEELGCVTDDVLENCLWESPLTKKKFQDLAYQLSDLQKAMDTVKTMR